MSESKVLPITPATYRKIVTHDHSLEVVICPDGCNIDDIVRVRVTFVSQSTEYRDHGTDVVKTFTLTPREMMSLGY